MLEAFKGNIQIQEKILIKVGGHDITFGKTKKDQPTDTIAGEDNT